MLRPVIYSTSWSPPSCAVRLAAKTIQLDVDICNVDLRKGDHFKHEYRKINPQSTVPTLDDNGFILSDSHAIMTYLVGKYAKNDVLYPKDLKMRAIVDQRLHYNGGVVFPLLRSIFKPLLNGTRNTIPSEALKELDGSYQLVDKLLENRTWLAGETYTLADISCITTLRSLSPLLPFDNYPNFGKWLKNCEEELPGFSEIVVAGTQEIHEILKSILKT